VSELDRVWAELATLRHRLDDLGAVEWKGDAFHADTATDSDTVDTLHAAASGADAHVLATDASGGITLNGQYKRVVSATAGRVEADIYKDTVDNSATAVFTITTTNEAGDKDAGVYSVLVHAVGYANKDAASATEASRGYLGAFTRAMRADGTGVNTAVTEIYESASAATDAGTRDVTTVTMTVAETSEYVQTVSFLVDVTSGNPGVLVHVELIWSGFTTPPTIAAT